MLPTDPSQADKSIVALMHGIKKQESGNDYNRLGDKDAQGNYTAAGSGQWSNQENGVPKPLQKGQIPTNFQGDAKTYGLDTNDFSPENQNKVMYARIADRKAKGYTPEQIVSEWNSGNKDKYLNTATSSGTGAVGKYDVAKHVSNVMSYAQEYAKRSGAVQQFQAQEGQPTDNAPQKDLLQKAGDVSNKILGVTGGKKVAESIGTLGGLAYEKAKGLFGGQDNSKYYDTTAPGIGETALDAVKMVATAGLIKGGGALLQKGLTSLTPMGNKFVVARLKDAVGPGESIASLPRKDAIMALENALKEMTLADMGSAEEKAYLKGLQALSPQLKQKILNKLLSGVLTYGGAYLAGKTIGSTNLGSTATGLMHNLIK